ncbi:MAG: hypothetical protein H8F28_23575 [Fibrella sp.]|nr:hypothetical protein [Armatimonadota bacterium]
MSNVELENEREAAGNDTSPNNPTAHSRRDFLRRASKQAVKEAVEIGAKVVPGGALVRQFVENADTREPNDIDDDPLAIPSKPAPTLLKNPLDWFATWREGRKKRDE